MTGMKDVKGAEVEKEAKIAVRDERTEIEMTGGAKAEEAETEMMGEKKVTGKIDLEDTAIMTIGATGKETPSAGAVTKIKKGAIRVGGRCWSRK